MTKTQQAINRLENRIQALETWIKGNHYTYTTSYTDGLQNAKEDELRELQALLKLLRT